MTTRKNCIITGANSGIGKAAAIQIASLGHFVTMACRDPDRGQSALKEVKRASGNDSVSLLTVDMSLQSSILNFVDNYKTRREALDVLIHNAAEFNVTQKTPNYTSEDRESVFATNHLGPVFMTDLLMDVIRQSSQGRIVFISSKGLLAHPRLRINLEDPEFRHSTYNVSTAYYQSKLAQLMYSYYLADKLRDTPVTVNTIRVTNVKVNLDRYPGLSRFSKWAYGLKSRFSITPEEMAKTYTYLALSNQISNTTGGYFDAPDKLVSSSKYSRDPMNISAVMEMTKRFLEGKPSF